VTNLPALAGNVLPAHTVGSALLPNRLLVGVAAHLAGLADSVLAHSLAHAERIAWTSEVIPTEAVVAALLAHRFAAPKGPRITIRRLASVVATGLNAGAGHANKLPLDAAHFAVLVAARGLVRGAFGPHPDVGWRVVPRRVWASSQEQAHQSETSIHNLNPRALS
jgi:hypothetical protein